MSKKTDELLGVYINSDSIDTVICTFEDGEPCDHKGCLSHISHPCERCGRTAGKGSGLLLIRKMLSEIEDEDK